MIGNHQMSAAPSRGPEAYAHRRSWKLARFILAGLLFAALPGEVSNQILIHRSVHGLFVTLANYTWFLAIAYGVSRGLERRLPTRFAARLCYFLLYGCI